MPSSKKKFAHQAKLRRNKLSVGSRNFVIIICCLLIISLLYQIKPACSRTILVPDEFGTIQEAVNNATAGDTIQVGPGIYYEHVVVTKSLTIIGENPQTTVVDGTANGTVFDIEASNVIISGFTIRNAGNNHAAIRSEKVLESDDYHRITGNIITTSQYGIYLSRSKRNTILNNTFINNPFGGIALNHADNTNITANTIVESAYGMRIMFSLNNSIIGNSLSQTSYAIHLTSSSTGNTVRRNFIHVQSVGVYSSSDNTTVDHNTVTTTEGHCGIYFYNCHNGSIYYNTLMNSSYGIRIYMPSSSSHNITNNKILNTDWAIELVNANDNNFTGNWIQQNTWGIYMSFSSYNTVYHNNFIENDMQANAGTGAGNLWDNGSEGNFWSDYEGEDTDPHDGIGDTAYRITPKGYDNFPLMTTWSEHDISIQNVTLSTDETHPGAIVNITVTVKNQANTSVLETFNVTAKYDLNVIETKTVNDLAQGATQTLTFNWNTTGVAQGNYTTSAEASTVPDELNTDDNNFTDGTIKIQKLFLGDINCDGIVNIDDLILLNQEFGSTPTSPNWNQEADLNEDDKVDALDLYLLAKDYGKTA